MVRGTRLIDRLAGAVAHIFYRIDRIGTIPPGPVILLPNHPNALLDPALVMATAGRPVRFLAKSTLFRGPLAPLVRAAGAIPVYRRQDGAAAGRNAETFAAVDAALSRGEAICVFPEGISHSSGMLEPLRTGAARMALSSFASGVGVQLVAVGINLERKTIFRSRAAVAYGRPFTVRPAAAGPGTLHAPENVTSLTNEIARHMRALLVEADPRADAALVDRVDRLYKAERPQAATPEEALARRKAIARAMHRLREERPEWYESALVQLRRYDDRLQRFGLRDTALDWEVTPRAAWAFIAREAPRAVLLVPIAAAATVVFAAPYLLTAAAAEVVSERDVTATAKVIGGVVIYGSWILLLSAIVWGNGGLLPAVLVLALLPAFAACGLFALEREAAAWRTARSWLSLRGARITTRGGLKRRRAELAGVLDQINEWMRR